MNVSITDEEDFDSQDDNTMESTSLESFSIEQCGAGIYSNKLVGDNIDKDVKPSRVRSDWQNKSLHYFQSYAICDQINTSHFLETHDAPTELFINDFLPTEADYDQLIIFCHISVTYLV